MAGYPLDDTLSSLVDEVITSLTGYTHEADIILTLTSAMTPTSTSFTYEGGDLGRGVVEIDEELVYVQSATAGTATIAPWGRGHRGTTAASHAADAAVYVAPQYPRSIVSREVNNTIRSLYPDLFAVRAHDTVAEVIAWQYELPIDVEAILAVEWRWDNLDGWHPLTGWEMTSEADSADFASRKFISVTEGLPVGARIHVVYRALPSLLSNPTSPFSSTGLPSTSRDVVVYGAASRLLPWLDTGRVGVKTVMSDQLDEVKPVGASVSLARELKQMYAARLQKERDALYARFPLRSHMVR